MIELAPMTSAEFSRYMETAVADYADAHVKAGDCEPAEAYTLAKADYDSLLPDGIATAGQHLYSARLPGQAEPVGMVWFELRERRGKKSAYIFDIQIASSHRGNGYGKTLLQRAEEAAAAMGAERMSLNVMGWNHAARTLYEKAGFHISGIGMTKKLAPAA
jgi:ribosomal protein S18 acetylase RimI-like enzyme